MQDEPLGDGKEGKFVMNNWLGQVSVQPHLSKTQGLYQKKNVSQLQMSP